MIRTAVRVVLLGAASVGVWARPVAAQTPNCTVTPAIAGNATDVCRKSADLFAFVVPQFGLALAGGNPVLGEGGTLGGWGKRTFTLRVSAVDGRLPDNTVPLTLTRSAAVADNFGAKRTVVPMASLDAAIGVFAGIPMGVTNIGGVDALISVTGVPRVAEGDLTVRPQGASVAFSFGGRVGILQESSIVPGLSVSWLRRKVPTLDVDYAPSNDTVQARNIALTTESLRLVASKRFVFVGLAGGIGRDKINGTTDLRAIVNESVLGVTSRAAIAFPTLRETVTRNTAFVNVSFGLPVARIVVEYGRAGAGDVRSTVNSFGDRTPSSAYSYGSAGVTVRF